jgi:hypothetical protein
LSQLSTKQEKELLKFFEERKNPEELDSEIVESFISMAKSSASNLKNSKNLSDLKYQLRLFNYGIDMFFELIRR